MANQFVIRAVDPNSDKFMHSANLWEVAIRNQLWAYGDAPLDFLKTYGLPRAHSPYATRRVWRVFGLVAPSVALPPNTNMWGDDYPFSVRADSPLSAQDLMRIQRDHYEGTQFDLTQGLASGPYGDPNRWDVAPVNNLTYYDMLQGTYERFVANLLVVTEIILILCSQVHLAVPHLVLVCRTAPELGAGQPGAALVLPVRARHLIVRPLLCLCGDRAGAVHPVSRTPPCVVCFSLLTARFPQRLSVQVRLGGLLLELLRRRKLRR